MAHKRLAPTFGIGYWEYIIYEAAAHRYMRCVDAFTSELEDAERFLNYHAALRAMALIKQQHPTRTFTLIKRIAL